eukprot:11201090-Lingulodinium_polyedra.AAC.1
MATCVTVGLLSKPIDDLVLTMLKIDQGGRIIMDMLDRRGPVHLASRELVQLFSEGQVADTAPTFG